MPKSELILPAERIEQAILLIRGQKVMLDRDLAELYGVATGVLNQAVKRNVKRFPEDFMFQLSADETEKWKSQIVISNPGARTQLNSQIEQRPLRHSLDKLYGVKTSRLNEVRIA